MIQIPRLYCIVHSASFPATAELIQFSTELLGAGCTLVQYRNKNASARVMLEQARELKQQLGSSVRLIMNDRADLCLAADFDGPVVGLEGVRRARELTRKPLVAIGGITRANADSVIQAGADSVAVISDLLREPRKSAEEFLRILR